MNFLSNRTLSNVLSSHARALYLRVTMYSFWMEFGCY